MKYNIINGTCLNPDQMRLFPICYLPDGTPCIVGTAPGQQAPDGTALAVFSPAGGRTSMHPGDRAYEVLYEIHKDDYVGVVDHGNSIAHHVLYCYRILFILNNLAYGEPNVH